MFELFRVLTAMHSQNDNTTTTFTGFMLISDDLIQVVVKTIAMSLKDVLWD